MNECARPLAPRVRLSLARDRIATERKRVARAPAVTWPAPARVVPPRASLCRDRTRARGIAEVPSVRIGVFSHRRRTGESVVVTRMEDYV